MLSSDEPGEFAVLEKILFSENEIAKVLLKRFVQETTRESVSSSKTFRRPLAKFGIWERSVTL